jgi:purine-binding chemotaxis protein CheW
MELQPVPDAPAYVRGMFNYRGDPVLAVDMVERLGRQNDVPYTLDTPVVLCRYKQRSVGLLVDEVLGLMASEEDTNLEDTFKNAIPPFTGVIRTQEKLALQVDFERLLDFDLTLDATDLDVDPSELLAQASS